LNDCINGVSSNDGGTYQLTIRDTLTECSNTTAIDLTVIPLPLINISATSPALCIDDTIPLTVTGTPGLAYNWSPAYGLDTTMGANVLVFADVDTVYVLNTLDPSTGCSRLDTIEVTVHPLPMVEAGPNQVTCPGSDLLLTGDPLGGTWTDPQGNIITGGVFNEFLPQVYPLQYQYIDDNGCFNQDSMRVCVPNHPMANFALDTLQGCTGVVIQAQNLANTLNDCLPATYTWSVQLESADCHLDSMGWQFVNSTANSIDAAFSFQRSGVYSIQLTVANFCDTVQTSQMVVIGEAPTVQIESPGLLCNRFSIMPSAMVSTCNGSAPLYEWSFPGATNTTTFVGANPPEITYPAFGVYTMSLTVTNSCGSTTDTYAFEIFNLPSVMASNDGPVCEDGNVQLLATAPTAVEFEWTGPENFMEATPNPFIGNIALNQAGIYTLVVTDGNGCTNSDTTDVVVFIKPEISIDPPNPELCIGDSIQVELDNADQFQWSPSDGLSTTTGPLVVIGPLTATTTYTITSIDTLTGCTDLDQLEVIVNPLPIVDAGVDTFVCAGANLQLGGNPAGGVWFDQSGAIIPGGVYINSITGLDTLVYQFQDNNACENQDELVVCVLTNPVADFTLDTLIGCTGAIIQTTNLSNTLEDCIAASYRWSVDFVGADCHTDSMGWAFANGNANSVAPSFSFQRSGAYRIQLEVANACDTVRTSQQVVIGAAPSVQIDSFDILCETFMVQPSATVSTCNSSSPLYEWFFPGATNLGSFVGANPPMLEYSMTGNYTITLTVTNVCGTTTQQYEFEIFERPFVDATNDGPSCDGDTIQLNSSSPSAQLYQWEGPAGFNSVDAQPIIPNAGFPQIGSYILTVTDAVGCTNAATTVVNILPLPDAFITSPDPVLCFGDTTVLYAVSDSVYNYAWLINNTTILGDSIVVFPDSTTSYQLLSTDILTGCQNV
ncbi:MAG: hypothetical protein AAGD05_09580, partial [Bacteroidota bacterium]